MVGEFFSQSLKRCRQIFDVFLVRKIVIFSPIIIKTVEFRDGKIDETEAADIMESGNIMNTPNARRHFYDRITQINRDLRQGNYSEREQRNKQEEMSILVTLYMSGLSDSRADLADAISRAGDRRNLNDFSAFLENRYNTNRRSS